MRRQSLTDEQIRRVIELIDIGDYTQKEIGERFGVSQGTISRYNRVKRMQFKIEHNAQLISELNKEILELKESMNMDTSKERKVPGSFRAAKVIVSMNDYLSSIGYTNKDRISFKGFITENRLDAVKYLSIHPEYHMYDIIEKYSGFKLASNLRSARFYFIIEDDLGRIKANDRISIREIKYKED